MWIPAFFFGVSAGMCIMYGLVRAVVRSRMKKLKTKMDRYYQEFLKSKADDDILKGYGGVAMGRIKLEDSD